MKYIIIRALCILSNNSKANISYSEDEVTEENSCSDIEDFRKKLKENINSKVAIIGVHVISINLIYAERDGRQ